VTQRRVYQCSCPYFVTFNVLDNEWIFQDSRKAELLYEIILNAGKLKYHFVYQFCIMPDHVHILCQTKPPIPQSGFSNPRCGTDYSKNGIADWKVRSAICINDYMKNICDCGRAHKYHISDFIKSIRGTFSRKIHEGQIWHPRFYDKIIDNDDKLWATIDYISNNPIKAGLPKKCRKYPYQFKAHKLMNELF